MCGTSHTFDVRITSGGVVDEIGVGKDPGVVQTRYHIILNIESKDYLYYLIVVLIFIHLDSVASACSVRYCTTPRSTTM